MPPRKGFQKAIDKYKADPQLQAKVHESSSSSEIYDQGSARLRARRELVKHEFVEFVKASAEIRGNQDVAGMTDEMEVLAWACDRERLLQHTKDYLSLVAITTVGRLGKKIKVDSLRERATSIWWWAEHFLGEHITTVYPQWSLQISAAVHQQASEQKLSISLRSKLECMRWEDIEWHTNPAGYGLSVSITVRWVKGHRDPYKEGNSQFRPAKFFVSSCENAANLPYDLPWLLLCLAWERGLFPQTKSPVELLTSKYAKLPRDAKIEKRPVFLTKKQNSFELNAEDPAMTSSFNGYLQKACKEVGIAGRVTIYSFRRELLTTAIRNVGRPKAQVIGLHHKNKDAIDAYDEPLIDLDMKDVVLSEGADLRQKRQNDLRRWLQSPAIQRRGQYPFEQEQAFIRNQLEQGESAQWNQATTDLLRYLVQRFQLNRTSSPVKVVADLGASAASREKINDDERSPEAWTRNIKSISNKQSAGNIFAGFLYSKKQFRKYLTKQLKSLFAKAWENQLPQTLQVEAEARARELETPFSPTDTPQDMGLTKDSITVDTTGIVERVMSWADDEMRDALEAGDSDAESESEEENLPEDLSSEADDERDVEGEDENDRNWDFIDDALQTRANADNARDPVEFSVQEPFTAPVGADQSSSNDVMERRKVLMNKWISLRTQSSGQVFCILCKSDLTYAGDGSFPSKSKLDRHIELEHTTGSGPLQRYAFRRKEPDAYRKWSCRICRELLSSAQALTEHMKAQHNDFYLSIQDE